MPLNFDSKSDNPLKALESNGYNVHSFTYPIDLTTDPAQQHFVVFYVNESTNTQFITKNTKAEFMEDGKIVTSFSGNGKLSSILPGGDSQAKVSQGNNISTWNARPIKRVPMAIALYMPPMIATTYAAEWGQGQMNATGGVVKAMSDGFSMTSIKQALSEIGIGILGGAVQDGADFVKSYSGADINALDGISLATRAAINPHIEMLFRKIGFRTFQFDFKFTPRSEKEALLAHNIIKAFAFYGAPEIRESKDAAKYYIFPAEFDIEFWSNGKPNDFLNKISTCALTSCTVNYTGSGGWSAFQADKMNGVPVECNLTLQFQELEIITKKRILQGY